MVGYGYCILHPLTSCDLDMELSYVGEEKHYLLGRPKSHSLPGKISLHPSISGRVLRQVLSGSCGSLL